MDFRRLRSFEFHEYVCEKLDLFADVRLGVSHEVRVRNAFIHKLVADDGEQVMVYVPKKLYKPRVSQMMSPVNVRFPVAMGQVSHDAFYALLYADNSGSLFVIYYNEGFFSDLCCMNMGSLNSFVLYVFLLLSLLVSSLLLLLQIDSSLLI